MDKFSFQQSAQAAISEAQAERLSMAQTQANDFISGSAQFDPRTLEKLGEAGMTCFLQTLHARGIADYKPSLTDHSASESTSSSPTATSTSGGATLGWAAMRRSEPLWALRALVSGTFAGISVLAVGTAYFVFSH